MTQACDLHGRRNQALHEVASLLEHEAAEPFPCRYQTLVAAMNDTPAPDHGQILDIEHFEGSRRYLRANRAAAIEATDAAT